MLSRVFRHSIAICASLSMVALSGVAAETREKLNPDFNQPGPRGEKRIEHRIEGPVLDYVFEQGVGLRPLLGIPGAAVWADVIPLPGIAQTAVSVERNYALGISDKDRLPMLISNLRGAVSIAALAESPGVDRIILSPTGAAAAVQRGASIEIVTGLPETSATQWSSTLPGAPETLAVADNGKAVIAVVTGGESRFAAVLAPAGGWRYLAAIDGTASVTFLRNREDAVFTDAAANQVFSVRDVTGAAQILALAGEREGISQPVAVAASADNRSVVVANSAAGGIVVLNLSGGAMTAVISRCASTGLERLAGNSVFRLTGPESPQLCLLDADSSSPRVVFVPPPPRVAGLGGAE